MFNLLFSIRNTQTRSFLITLPLALVVLLLFTVAVKALDNGQNADKVLGQLDFVSAAGGVSASQMTGPRGVAVDPTTGKVFVGDTANNRVLRFASWDDLANGQAAEGVLGQPSLNANTPGTTQTTMNAPTGVHVDQDGRLWVADTGNHRVLRFNNAAAQARRSQWRTASWDSRISYTGNPNFGGGPAQNNFNTPTSVFVEPEGDLWVADSQNHRVLRFANAALRADGDPATGVLGHDGYESSARNRESHVGPETMAEPVAVYVEKSGRDLWVADSGNHRVLRFDAAYFKANGADADGVLGQPDFNTAVPATTQSGFYLCGGVAGSDTGALYVNDTGNNRILVFNAADAKMRGENADNVLGQPDFVSGLPNRGGPAAANTLKSDNPSNLFVDDEALVLWTPDDGNHRVLAFQIVTATPEDVNIPFHDPLGGCFVGTLN